jgi:carbon storage regulator
MLVLSRRHGEQILVGDNVIIKVLGVAHGRVRVGIEAPPEVPVRRSELLKSDNRRHENPASPRRAPHIAALAGMVH